MQHRKMFRVCGGVCACGTCQCPDQCDDGNACTTESCNPNLNGGGCLYKSVTCNDNNRCTHDSCSPATGCVYTDFNIPVDCNDGDLCTIPSCTPSQGCLHTPVNCTFYGGNPCLLGAICSPGNGSCGWWKENICNDDNSCTEQVCTGPNNGPPCSFKPIDCTRGDKCISPICFRNATDPHNGCTNLTVTCDDGNACTDDTCNSATGCVHTPKVCNDNNACTDDTCDDQTGCKFEPFNVTERCNAGELCTNYTCDANVGCVSAPIRCDNTFNDSCLWVICDPLVGCTPAPKQCNYTGTDPKKECYINYCDSSKTDTDNCYYEQTDECKLTVVVASTGAAILGVGAIVGIVIAAVVCVGTGTTLAVLGFNGAFSGEFENKNPLYEKETKEGKNPLYKRNSKAPKPN